MCLMWTAGAFQAEGAEVCNGYKFMPNDRSMLQYGFLQVTGEGLVGVGGQDPVGSCTAGTL
jgi:hypothetical protein